MDRLDRVAVGGPVSVLTDQREDRLLTVDDAAALLQVSADLVRRWVQADQVPFIRLGHRTIRFRRSSLEAWLADRERGL